jgi:hypothetical protein
MNQVAIRNNAQGQQYIDKRGDLRKAEIAFYKAIEAAPNWSVPWYNLGLLYKREKNWSESLRCNRKASQLDPTDEAAWWNLGIAATALGNWPEARRAWTAFGVELPPGEGEIVMRLGLTPIRLNPENNGEVVWCSRIDPARAIIRNVPLPSSGHRYGDLLLHDGAPNGYRQLHGRDVPVFDELHLLAASDYATFEVTIQVATQEALHTLIELIIQHDLAAEDWGTIRQLCHECSTGRLGPYEENQLADLDQPIQIGIAAPDEQLLHSLLAEWAARPGRQVVEVTCVLE